MVEEPVLSPKHLWRLHDDGLRKLISHCSLSYSLERNIIHKDQCAWMNPLIHIYWIKGVHNKAQMYLVPQVFGWAAYVCVEVRHVDKLCDTGLSGCLCNLLRDRHKDVLEVIVPLHRRKKNISLRLYHIQKVFNSHHHLNFVNLNCPRHFCCLYLVSHSLPTRLMTTFECSKARLMESLSLAFHSCNKTEQWHSVSGESWNVEHLKAHLTIKMICPRSPIGFKYMRSYWSQRWGMTTWEPIRPVKSTWTHSDPAFIKKWQ